MRRLWTLLAISALGLGTAANAQPPGNERARPGAGGPPNREQPRDQPRTERGGETRTAPTRTVDAPRGGSHVEQWTRMLAEHMIDPHDSVRDSARAGLVAMGEKALPMLRNLANGPDDARATAAKKVIEAIERANRRPGPATVANRSGPGGPDRTGGGFGFGSPMGRGGPPFASGGPAPFNRGPMTGGFPGGGDRRPEGRPMGNPMGGERRPDAPRPDEGRPMERRPEGGERRPDAPRPVEGRPMERRPEGGERREGERRPEAPRPTERRPQ